MKKFKNKFKEITWLFIIGCLIGFILETLWYYLKHGIIINKQGVLYGPFKPIYGFAVVLITILFSKIKTNNNIKIFIIGIILGTSYEYLTSLFQEFILKTSTWNYSSFKFNLNGRIYLPYCIAWGIITLIWIKILYPKFKKIIDKIPFNVTLIIAILMIINLVLSAFAVHEYSNRQNNLKTNNKVLKLMDDLYPDDIMKTKFPKLKAIKK